FDDKLYYFPVYIAVAEHAHGAAGFVLAVEFFGAGEHFFRAVFGMG
ncbi:MAG: hypothetical protein ACJAX1_003166, partial [Neolewinella sp.]